MSTVQTSLSPAEPAASGRGRRGWARLAEPLATEFRALPVIAGILVLVVYFASQSSYFLSSRNLSNLLVQTVVTGTIALGLVFVLLLGEIDLSVAATSGVTSVLMAKLVVASGVNGVVAVLVAVALGAAIGCFIGLWATRFKVPSFVVTLGVGLVLNGIQLMMLPTEGRYSLVGTGLEKIAGTYITGGAIWILVLAFTAYVFLLRWTAHRRNVGFEIDSSLLRRVIVPTVTAAVAAAIVVAELNANEGVPTPVVIFGVLLALASYTLNETRFGLHLYAVGGNAEAALRAGVKVDRMKIAAFGIAGALAAVGGIIAASRILGVSVSSGGGIGGGAQLLNSIAAAVIGGVSLFGGRGRASAALLGALVIGIVSNGLNLLGIATNVQLVVTGTLLVLAVTVDRSIERMTEVGR